MAGAGRALRRQLAHPARVGCSAMADFIILTAGRAWCRLGHACRCMRSIASIRCCSIRVAYAINGTP